MNPARRSIPTWLARIVLGGLFVYMGFSKALQPVDFLKLVRQYELVDYFLVLNLIAAWLPWFEVFCGLLLLTGVAVRGTALMLVLMLIPFTLLILRRALIIHAGYEIPFCMIKFDCGCGGGIVLVCYKLLENSLLLFLSACLVVDPRPGGSPLSDSPSERPDRGSI